MSQYFCPKCNTQNSNDRVNCFNCGFTIRRDNDPVDVPKSERKCVQCDEILTDDNSTCSCALTNNSSENSQNLTKSKSILNCQKCNYPLIEESQKCPQCNFVISNKNIPQTQESTTVIPVKLEDNIGSENDEEETRSTISLIALSIGNAEHSDLNFNSQCVKIGREDISGEDKSISSEHLILTNEDNNWYIENKASNKATFLVVNGKQKIEDGDIVLIGNSKFYKIKLGID